MGSYAKINKKTRIVEEVISATNEYIMALDDFEDWIQTSYNTKEGVHLLGGVPLRKNFASIGYYYDHERDAFIPPKPYESWVLDEERAVWVAPVEKPEGDYRWDEESTQWIATGGGSDNIGE